MQNDKFRLVGPTRDPWETYGSSTNALALPVAIYGASFFVKEFQPLIGPIFAVSLWAVLYLANLPLQVWHIAVRPEPGDPRWSAKVLVVGAWPYALFLLFWPELTTRAGLLVTFPIIALSGVTAIVIAERRKAPTGGGDAPEGPPERGEAP